MSGEKLFAGSLVVFIFLFTAGVMYHGFVSNKREHEYKMKLAEQGCIKDYDPATKSYKYKRIIDLPVKRTESDL